MMYGSGEAIHLDTPVHVFSLPLGSRCQNGKKFHLTANSLETLKVRSTFTGHIHAEGGPHFSVERKLYLELVLCASFHEVLH